MKINTQMPPNLASTPVGADSEVDLNLPVPVSDGQGGLYTKLMLRWMAACSAEKSEGCGKQPRLSAHYEGSRLQDLTKVHAKGW